jgi:hypothetical protein
VKKAITDKTPDQLKFPFALWTCRAVQQLITQLFSIEMPIQTLGEYLPRQSTIYDLHKDHECTGIHQILSKID